MERQTLNVPLPTRNLRIDFDRELLARIQDKKNNSKVKLMLRALNLFNTQDRLGNTILHFAAKHNNHEIAQFLIESGSDVAIRNDVQETPLIVATENNSREVIQVLLTADADIYDTSSSGKNALNWFLCGKYIIDDVLQIILNKIQTDCSNDSNLIADILFNARCPLPTVILMKNIEITKIMLARGCPVDSLTHMKKETALHLAVMWTDVELVKLLLQYNANPNVMNYDYRTPISYIYKNNKKHSDKHLKILKMLIVRNASLTILNNEGYFSQINPILQFGNRDAIQHLLFDSLNLNGRIDSKRNTPIHVLVKNKDQDVLRVLDKQYFNVNAQNSSLQTPLFVAVNCGNVSAVEYLLKRGANVNVLDNFGYSVLLLAVKTYLDVPDMQYKKCIEILLENGADAQQITFQNDIRKSVIQLFDKKLSDVSQLIIEHLVLQEALGTVIIPHIRSEIEEVPTFKAHYYICRKQLAIFVDKPLTLLDLMSVSDVKFVKYVRNLERFSKIERFCEDDRLSIENIKKILLKRINKAVWTIKLQNSFATAICKIMGMGKVDLHLITDRIIRYLSEKDLQNFLEATL